MEGFYDFLSKTQGTCLPSFYKGKSPSLRFHHTRCPGTNFERVPDDTSSLKLQYFLALIPPGLNTSGENRRSARSVRVVSEGRPLPSASTPLRAPTTAWPGARANRGTEAALGEGSPFLGEGESRRQDEAAWSSGQPRTLPPPSPPLSGRHFKPSPAPIPRGGRLPSLSFYLFIYLFPTL